jgi:hypothetical protein
MTDDPEADRIALLIAELDELPLEEREAALAGLSEEDRNAVWAAEAEAVEEALDEVLPDDDGELGGGD